MTASAAVLALTKVGSSADSYATVPRIMEEPSIQVTNFAQKGLQVLSCARYSTSLAPQHCFSRYGSKVLVAKDLPSPIQYGAADRAVWNVRSVWGAYGDTLRLSDGHSIS